MGSLPGNLLNLHPVARAFGQWLPFLLEFLHDHVNDLADVLECFLASLAPRRAAQLFECRTVDMPARRISVEILVG